MCDIQLQNIKIFVTLSFRGDIHHERFQIDLIQKNEIEQKDVASENMRDMDRKICVTWPKSVTFS